MGYEPESGPAIHVVLRKEDLDTTRIAGKTIVVVDVLFATTSIIAALDAGAAVVYPAMDAGDARALAGQTAANRTVLSGESMFQFIDGFVQPTPLALRRHIEPEDALIYTTTNGTVALRASAGARRVLVGSLINAGATAASIDDHDAGTIIILCAGTAGSFNLEDFYGAGCLVDRIAGHCTGHRLTDSAIAARDCFRASEPEPALSGSLVGRLIHRWGLDDEIAFAARIDSSDLAAELRENRVEAIL